MVHRIPHGALGRNIDSFVDLGDEMPTVYLNSSRVPSMSGGIVSAIWVIRIVETVPDMPPDVK